MIKKEFPILEFDGVSRPVVDVKKYLPPFVSCVSDMCLITYFSDVVDSYERVFKVNQVFKIRTEGVRPRVFLMEAGAFKKPVYVIPVPIGAPQAARVVEAMAALGVKKFMVCGGAGTLDDSITENKILIPTSAVRDEGTSYHYMPPSREIELNKKVLTIIEKTFLREKINYQHVKTWTTDAIFRETADKVAQRKTEGCNVVEMECSAYYCVAKHLGLMLGQILYAADVVMTDAWDHRDWHDKYDMREKLFELALKCLLAF
ncbi:MAG: nucleoside phosphorylase [Firmicutes bacterium]|nr:nucleoside phosphorylase [Bacillota bacterium]